mgnify:CR=1 FL=1
MENILHQILMISMIISSLLVLSSKNPVHSVMFLILVFLGGAGILLYLGAEFIALMFIIVYVGAIAVLFLFIVMMLDIKLNQSKTSLLQYLPFGLIFGILFILELYMSMNDLFLQINFKETNLSWYVFIDNLTNTELIGQILYQEFLLCFLLCGILLLIAMLGAIVLTQNFSSYKTNEIVAKQLSRGNQGIFLFFKK